MRHMEPLTVQKTESAPAKAAGPLPSPKRLVSLDAFRGATIALMVIVNSPGDGGHAYGPLNHSAWNGWTLTDVVFPSFLWIVGVAMTLSLGKRLAAGVPRMQLYTQVLRRAAILYVLGLVIYGFPRYDLSTLRLMGVLQRIAICYAIAAAIYLTTSVRGQIIWIASLLTSYWLVMMLIPVPGYGAGHLDVERNLAHYVDRVVLGAHNYANTRTWDPEGIISTLPAIATALFGIMAGHILRARKELAERTTWLFLAGNLLIALGLICNQWLPINKKLWTSSFSLFMAGLDFVIFAICIWLIDARGYQRFLKPAVIMGMNAIVVYMASEMGEAVLSALHCRGWIYQTFFAPLASPYNASLIYAVTYMLLMYLIAYVMYRRGWFVRV
jgi:predicted acyltransferase